MSIPTIYSPSRRQAPKTADEARTQEELLLTLLFYFPALRQRRIKCDEKRPACTQCVRSNKVCTGYPPPSRSARPHEEIRIAPKPLALQAAPGYAPAASAAPVTSAPNPILRRETVLPPRRANRRQRLATAASAEHQRVVSAPAPPPIVYQPAPGLPFLQTEAMYFHLFRTHTASELSGYFDSVFWTQRVLQECHSEVAIRHAVVALGALYKTLEQSCEPWGAASNLRESIMAHWQVAVKQYSEACNGMVLLKEENQKTHRTRLMASVLLACFDCFIGDHRQAIIQIQTGLGLLEQLQADRRQHGPSSPGGEVEEELVIIFTRLAIQAKSYDLAFHFPEPYVIRLLPHLHHTVTSSASSDASSPSSVSSTAQPSPGPYGFTTVREARLAADQLGKKMLLFLERLYAAKEEPSNVLPNSWKQYGLSFRAKLEAWHEAYEPIFQSRLAPGVHHLEKAGIAALKMFQINAQILFMMMFCDTEDQFDAFYPHFRAIVDLGLEVVVDDEHRAAAALCCPGPAVCRHRKPLVVDPVTGPEYAAHHIKPSFSADLGIVPPLFVVATKCRDPVLRRQSIQLLRSSARREGMWDSELAAHIGQWIMQLEEAEEVHDMFGGHPSTSSLGAKMIPEHKRVMVKSVDFDLRARYADVRVGTRGLRHGLPDERARETHMTW